MRKEILFTGLLLLGIHLHLCAQEKDNSVKYIFKSTTDLKGFGTFDMKLSQIVDDTGLLLGGTGGVTVNKYLLFGLGGYGIVTKTRIPDLRTGEPLRLYGGYGGILLGFNILPREVVHISLPVLIGAGNIDLVDETFFTNSFDEDFTIERSAFFVAEPGLLVEINITNFFHLGMGASYRFIDGLRLDNLSNSQISDWSGNLVFKFGRF